MKTQAIIGILALSSLSGCAGLGTKLTVQTSESAAPRAVDQEVLASAVDKAFDELKLPKFEPLTKDGDKRPITAWIEVKSSSALPAAVLEYTNARASAASGAAGLGIQETRQWLDRSKDGTWNLLLTEYPDTDARVIVTIAYAGIDESREEIAVRSSDTRSTVIKGRFKAVVSVIPRTAAIAPFTQTIHGESRYELIDGKYLDRR